MSQPRRIRDLFVPIALLSIWTLAAAGCSGEERACSDDSDCFKGEVCMSSDEFEQKICVTDAPEDGAADSGSRDADVSPPNDVAVDSAVMDSKSVDSTDPGDTNQRDTGRNDTSSTDTGPIDTGRPDTSRADAPPADSGDDTGDTCTPTEEACNGVDDDCDGDTDEPKPCQKDEGVCSGATSNCTNGSYTSCGPSDYGSDYETDESTIDGKDNDCDGKTDEVFATVDFESNDLICGRTINDHIYCWGTSFRLSNFNVSFPITSDSYVQLGVADAHICARDSSDQLHCWGEGGVGGERTNPPSGNYVDVDAGGAAGCAIANSDASVDCWGSTSGSRSDLSFSRLSVGQDYCGVTTSQDVECWGNSVAPELENNVPSGTYSDVETYDDFACAISAGGGSTSGSVTCWGPGSTPDPPASLANGFSEVGIGAPADSSGNIVLYGCGLDAQNGSIGCWGGTKNMASPPSGTFLDIAVGSNGGCAVRDDHTIECWGIPSGPP